MIVSDGVDSAQVSPELAAVLVDAGTWFLREKSGRVTLGDVATLRLLAAHGKGRQPAAPGRAAGADTSHTGRHGGLVGSSEAARRLGVSERTLRNLAGRGEGPPRLKVGGAVRYDPADLDGYVEGLK